MGILAIALVVIGGIGVAIGYHVWQENRHLKADVVRSRRFEALVYGLTGICWKRTTAR